MDLLLSTVGPPDGLENFDFRIYSMLCLKVITNAKYESNSSYTGCSTKQDFKTCTVTEKLRITRAVIGSKNFVKTVLNLAMHHISERDPWNVVCLPSSSESVPSTVQR